MTTVRPMTRLDLERLDRMTTHDLALVESRWSKGVALAWALSLNTWPSRRFRVVYKNGARDGGHIHSRLLNESAAKKLHRDYQNMGHNSVLEQIIPDNPQKSKRFGPS